MIENKKVMSKNILYYMNKQNVNAVDICKACGFKQNTFSDWVNAKTYPRIDKIELMAQFFGITKADLVEQKDTNDTPEAKSIRDGYKRGFPVNGTEMLIIEHYRIADPDIQKAILKLLDLEYEFGGGYESSLGLSKVANDR